MAFNTLQKSDKIILILILTFILTNKKLYRKLPKIRPIYFKIAMHTILTFTLTLLMWLEILTTSDINEASNILYIALTETAMIVKIFWVWYHEPLIEYLFGEWKRNEMFILKTVQERVMWQRTMKIFGVVSFLYLICGLSSSCFAFIAVLFMNERKLPLPFWLPHNWKSNSNYWYAYFYNTTATTWTCLTNSALDMLFCYLMQHLTLQFKVVSMRLEALGTEDETNAEITNKMVSIIKLHHKLRSMATTYETIVSWPLFTQISLSALVLCFSLYRLQNCSITEDPVDFISLVQYATTMILQVYLFCYYANQLTIASSSALESTYNCNWPDMSAYNRKLILIYMEYLKEPVVIRAGGFFNVDLVTFTKTINKAYSFFALLLHMDD